MGKITFIVCFVKTETHVRVICYRTLLSKEVIDNSSLAFTLINIAIMTYMTRFR